MVLGVAQGYTSTGDVRHDPTPRSDRNRQWVGDFESPLSVQVSEQGTHMSDDLRHFSLYLVRVFPCIKKTNKEIRSRDKFFNTDVSYKSNT